ALVAATKERTLLEHVGWAESGALPHVEVTFEIGGADRATQHDAGGEVGDTDPLADLLDHPVAEAIEVGKRRVRRDGNENEDVRVPLRSDPGVNPAGLADIETGRVGDVSLRAEDRVKVGAPVAGEQQGVVLKLG